jgi:hypothetical protein
LSWTEEISCPHIQPFLVSCRKPPVCWLFGAVGSANAQEWACGRIGECVLWQRDGMLKPLWSCPRQVASYGPRTGPGDVVMVPLESAAAMQPDRVGRYERHPLRRMLALLL